MAELAKTQSRSEGLAVKTVKGSAYSIGTSAVTMVLGFGRSVLMARLLTPEDFGVVAFAMTFLSFTAPLRNFGLDQALIHHKFEESSSLGEALAVHFFLRLVLISFFVLLLLAAMPVLRYFYPQKTMLVPVLLTLTVGDVAIALGSTPTAYLRKEMRFKELSVLQLLTSLSMTVIGPLMAWQGWGVWAIVAERISGVIVAAVVVWVVIRPWRFRLGLDMEKVRWYLGYGRFIFATLSFGKALEEFDDFWIGTTLGNLALGYYSKAYEIALYPRRVISDPLTAVVFPLFAKLQDNRLQLSKAYFRFSSLVTRISFLLGGVLVLGASDFVYLILGEMWMPMVITFQLMIFYVLLDPLVMIGASLAQAVGHPGFWTRTRVVQVGFFVPAVILGSRFWQINGVALATDLALLLGLVLLFLQNRHLVDISLRRLFGFPTLALLLGAGISWQISPNSVWGSQAIGGILKVLAFVFVYLMVLLLTECRTYANYARKILRLLTVSPQ